MDFDLEFLTQIGTAIGIVGAIFLVLYFKEKASNRKIIERKNGQIEETNEKLIDIVEKNTEAFVGIKGSLDGVKEAIRGNTKATNSLSQQVISLLTKGK